MSRPSTSLLSLTVLAGAALASAQVPPRPGGDAPAPAPQVAPEGPRGLVARRDGAFDGYTLYAPLRSRTTYLVDMTGEVVHEWTSEHPPGNAVYLMDDGRLLRCCKTENERMHGGGEGGRIQEHAWDGTLTWDFACSDDRYRQHHDIEPLPNGNVLVLVWEYLSRDEALALGRDPSKVTDAGWWPDAVLEVAPRRPDGGEVVWEWHARDHLVQDHDRARAGYGDVAAHPERIDVNGDFRSLPPQTEEDRRRQAETEAEMRRLGYAGGDEDGAGPPRDRRDGPGRGPDGPPGRDRGRDRLADWMHTNSIDHHPELDLIVLSVRRFDEFWVIDHSTTRAEAAGSRGGRFGRGGDLLYRWGNPVTYGRGQAADRQLFGQHDASFVRGADGGLAVLLFNNGQRRPGGDHSSVDEIALPFDAERGFLLEPERAFGPERAAWSYTAPEKGSFYSSFISGAQRLPNGNTLIVSGVQGRVFEVTRAGDVVWDYLNPHGGEVEERGPGGPGPGGMSVHGLFRAARLAPEHPGLAERLRR